MRPKLLTPSSFKTLKIHFFISLLGSDACQDQGLFCHDDAECVEFVVGGWQCQCNEGFVGDGQQCSKGRR